MDVQFAANPQFLQVNMDGYTGPIQEALVVGYVQFDRDRREGCEWRVLLFAGPGVTEDFGGYATKDLAKTALFNITFKSLNS